jgi:hypothetical protein
MIHVFIDEEEIVMCGKKRLKKHVTNFIAKCLRLKLYWKPLNKFNLIQIFNLLPYMEVLRGNEFRLAKLLSLEKNSFCYKVYG